MTYAIHYSTNTWSNNQQTQMTDEAVKEQLEYISDKNKLEDRSATKWILSNRVQGHAKRKVLA